MARLTYADGDVRVDQAGDRSGEVSAALNMPLLEGTILSTANDGRAEIQFEDGSLVRLTPNTSISLVNLSIDANGDFQTHVALASGLVYAELRAGTKYRYSLDAGGEKISPAENATLRIGMDQLPAVLSVLDGMVHVVSPTGVAADVAANQSLRADAQSGQFLVRQGFDADTWDQWNEDRDEAAAQDAGAQTTVRDNVAGDQGYGWADLDADGSWYDVPGQGNIWQPTEAADAGFDPYGDGSWAWMPAAGYVYVSAYPWGWLPYRCGRWNFWSEFGWGWQPSIVCRVHGFGGHGYRIRLGRVPVGYRQPVVPIGRPGRPHPLVRVQSGVASGTHTAALPGPRTFAGHVVEPLQPIGGGYTPRGGTALGWGLKRDFPVDTATHLPLLGVASTHAATSATNFGATPWRPAGASPRTVTPAYRAPALPRSNPVSPSVTPFATRPVPAPQPAPRPAYTPRPATPPSPPRPK